MPRQAGATGAATYLEWHDHAVARSHRHDLVTDVEDLGDAFVSGVANEGRMFGTRAETLGGPQTAKRLAEDTSTENTMAAHGMHLAEQVGTAKWLSAIKTAVRMWRDRQDARGNPRLNEQIAHILFQTPIEQTSELGQRLTGQFTGPQSVNRLAPAGAVVEQLSSVLAPGAGSSLSQTTQ